MQAPAPWAPVSRPGRWQGCPGPATQLKGHHVAMFDQADGCANYRPGRLSGGRSDRAFLRSKISILKNGISHEFEQNRHARLERDTVPAQDVVPDEGGPAPT